MNVPSFCLSKNKLNYILAQKSRKKIQAPKKEDLILPLNKSMHSSQIQSTTRGPYYPGTSKREDSVVQYPNDILDSFSENRSFVENMRSVSKQNYLNYKDQYNASQVNTVEPKNGLSYFSYQKQNGQFMSKKKRKSKCIKEKKVSKYMQSLDNSMEQISTVLSKMTFQLTKNTRHLERLHEIAESERVRPSKRSILRRANFKYADFDQQRQKFIQRKPKLEYQDKVYKDPKYIIWNPRY